MTIRTPGCDDPWQAGQVRPRGILQRLFLAIGAATLALTPLLASENAYAQAAKSANKPEEIRYVYLDQSIFPYVANERGEQIDGPLLRLAAAVFGKAGIPWRGEPVPAARLFQNMKSGTSNFTILVHAPSLDECCIVSKKSVIGADLRSYRINNTPAVKSWEQLRGKTVITVAGYSYGGKINFLKDPANSISIEVAQTHRSGFAMLKAGRGEYFLDYDGASEQALKSEPVPNLANDVIDRINLYFILARAYPDAEKVMERLEAIYNTVDMGAIFKF